MDSFKEFIRTKLFGKDFSESDPNKLLGKQDLEKRLQEIKEQKISNLMKEGSEIN